MFLQKLAKLTYRFRKSVVSIWIALLLGLTVLSGQVGTSYSDAFTLPDSESKVANTLLEGFTPAAQKETGSGASATSTSKTKTTSASSTTGSTIQIVFATTDGVLTQSQLDTFLADISALDHVTSAQSPLIQGGGSLSANGKIGISNVQLDLDRRSNTSAIKEILKIASANTTSSFEIALYGPGVSNAETPSSSTSSELIGLGVAAIVLFVTFGSLVSALTPIFIAVFALGSSTATIGLLSNNVDISSNGPVLGALMGLSVGIDYALFVVTRFRQEIKNGKDTKTALELSMQTSGRSVLFAGIIVSFAVLGIFSVQLSVLDGLALSAFVAVLFSLAAALTLLPATLALLGSRINRLTLSRLGKGKAPLTGGWWAQTADLVAKRPWVWLISVSMSMLLLCIPTFSIQLGEVNAGSDQKGTTTRTAYDLISTGFGDGYLNPLTVVAKLSSTGSIAEVESVAAAITSDSGVESVTQAVLDESKELAVFSVYPSTSSEDDRTNQLIARLRATTIPDAIAGTELQVYVGGATAGIYDLASTVKSRLLAFIGAVIALSMLFMLVLFRSIAIPIKSGFMNLLSVGAAMGVVTAFFQWGWGASLIGAAVGPIEPFVPVLMFAILFGLSMDYEVFLVSRIQEDYLATGDNLGSVRRGLQSSAGIITAAASIMVAVFLAFLQADIRIIQELAIGLALAIVLDATLIRTILVPALMQLLGNRNWWLPAWLAKMLTQIKVE